MTLSIKPLHVGIGALGLSILAYASTMFLNQPQRYINRDPAANSTDTISTLSCIIHHTGAHLEATPSNPNPSAYEALIDVESCRPNAVVSENTVPNYTRYWVEPKLENGTLTVKAWSVGSLRPSYILAQVQSGAGESPPYGQWTVDWCVERLADEPNLNTDPCARKGHITISQDQNYQLYYREEVSGTQPAFERLTNGVIATDSSTGLGRYFERFNDLSTTDRNGFFAFESGALLDQLNNQTVCKDPREGSGFKRAIWEAWLYDPTTQERVNYNGGFPVKEVNGTAVGWAGFEGVRLAGSATPEISGSFERIDRVGGIYTAFGSYGKLIKNTNTIVPNGLQDLDGLILRIRLRKDAFASLTDYIDADGNDQQFVLMHWDHAAGHFVLLARDKFATGVGTGREFVDVNPPRTLTPAQYLQLAQTEARSFERRIWAFQLGSNNQFVIQLADYDVFQTINNRNYPTVKPINEIKVFRQIQTNVVPGSADAPTEGLVCIGKCPRPNGNTSGTRLTLEERYDFPQDNPRATQLYTFDNTTGGFTVGGIHVRTDRPETNTINRNGIDTQRQDLWLGTFVKPSQLSDLECRDGFCVWDTVGYERRDTAGQTFGDVGLVSYYNWNTGPQRWQRFSGVKDSQGRIVAINEPLMLTYNAPNDLSEFGRYANKKVSLRYPGNGQLWLPGRCENIADPDAATDPGCNQENEVFIHDFLIPTDTGARGRVQDANGNEYLVKWTRQGVFYPQHSNPNACNTTGIETSFARAQNLTLPTVSQWSNPRPAMGAVPVQASSPSNPKYINGVATN